MDPQLLALLPDVCFLASLTQSTARDDQPQPPGCETPDGAATRTARAAADPSEDEPPIARPPAADTAAAEPAATEPAAVDPAAAEAAAA